MLWSFSMLHFPLLLGSSLAEVLFAVAVTTVRVMDCDVFVVRLVVVVIVIIIIVSSASVTTGNRTTTRVTNTHKVPTTSANHNEESTMTILAMLDANTIQMIAKAICFVRWYGKARCSCQWRIMGPPNTRLWIRRR